MTANLGFPFVTGGSTAFAGVREASFELLASLDSIPSKPSVLVKLSLRCSRVSRIALSALSDDRSSRRDCSADSEDSS